MSQNLIDVDFTADTLGGIDTALSQLETLLDPLIALTPEQRRQLNKMGDKSEAFCRLAMDVFSENPGVLSRNFDLDGFRRDLRTLDALRPRLLRIGKLQQHLQDSEMALGSDLMASALEGYAFLKVAGKGEGLDNMRKMLSARFTRANTRPADPPQPAPAVAS